MGEVAPARIMISVQLRAAPNSAAARAHEPHCQPIHHEANGAPDKALLRVQTRCMETARAPEQPPFASQPSACEA